MLLCELFLYQAEMLPPSLFLSNELALNFIIRGDYLLSCLDDLNFS